MRGRTAYLDTSAFLKLLVREPESDALLRALVRWQDRASASLVRTEAIRALRRAGKTQPSVRHAGCSRECFWSVSTSLFSTGRPGSTL
jgi:predicted nucleic acid-binding protein